jgi:hypothetical protein
VQDRQADEAVVSSGDSVGRAVPGTVEAVGRAKGRL